MEVIVFLTKTVNAPATGKPAVSGEARVDETLTADPSGIEDENGIPEDATFTYQWTAGDGTADSDIEGAEGQTYTLTSSEVGKLIKVRVGFTDSDGFAESVTSDPTGAVSGTNVFWSATMTVKEDYPTIPAFVGYGSEYIRTARLLPPLTSPAARRTTRLQTIALSGSYLLAFNYNPRQLGDTRGNRHVDPRRGRRRRGVPPFRRRQYNGGGNYQWSNPGLSWIDGQEVEVALKQVSEVNVAAAGAPAVTGTARVGELLTADVSGITDENGIPDDAAYSYQWVSGDGVTDTDLPGGTGPAYLLSDAEEGRTVRVRVGFTDADGFEETLTSAATGPVAASSTVRVPWSANLTVGYYFRRSLRLRFG